MKTCSVVEQKLQMDGGFKHVSTRYRTRRLPASQGAGLLDVSERESTAVMSPRHATIKHKHNQTSALCIVVPPLIAACWKNVTLALLSLLQSIVGRHLLLSFPKGSCSVLKEMTKGACRGFEQLLSRSPRRYFEVIFLSIKESERSPNVRWKSPPTPPPPPVWKGQCPKSLGEAVRWQPCFCPL